MRWIKKHKLISFLLAVILVSLVVLVVSVGTGGGGNPVSNFFGSVYSAVEKPLSKLSGGISDNISGIFSYKEIQKENERLQEENQELRQQVTSLTLTANELQELQELSEVLNYRGISGTDDIVSADVISMDGTNWMNIFTIDAGSESGIEAIDTLLTSGGINNMMYSISLTIIAMMFGGIMEKTRQLDVLVSKILKFVKTPASLVVATEATCVLSNAVMPEQYISYSVTIYTSSSSTFTTSYTSSAFSFSLRFRNFLISNAFFGS